MKTTKNNTASIARLRPPTGSPSLSHHKPHSLLNSLKYFLLLATISIFFLACSDNGGSTPNPVPDPPFTATVLPRSTTPLTGTFVPDDYRTHYAVFSLKIGTLPAGDYKIGAKIATGAAPTAAELVAATAAITRSLSTTTINIYLTTHIEGTYYDAGVTKTAALAQSTMLSPNTGYKVYMTLADGSGAVEEILSITTDASYTGTDYSIYGMPSGSFTLGAESLLFQAVFEPGTSGSGGIEWGNPTYFSGCSTIVCFPAVSGVYAGIANGTSGIYIYEESTPTATTYSIRDANNSSFWISSTFVAQ